MLCHETYETKYHSVGMSSLRRAYFEKLSKVIDCVAGECVFARMEEYFAGWCFFFCENASQNIQSFNSPGMGYYSMLLPYISYTGICCCEGYGLEKLCRQ